MGSDKALLASNGITWLAQIARVIHDSGIDPVCVVGRLQPEAWPGTPPLNRVRFIDDPPERRGSGPLGGLLTALETLPETSVVVVACDMPGLTPAAFEWLHAVARVDAGLHGVISLSDDGEPEPLFSVYRPAVLPLVREQWGAGRRSLRGLIAAGDFTRVPVPQEHRSALINVNTPDELQAFRAGAPTFPP